jgi:integrase/transposase-like protein
MAEGKTDFRSGDASLRVLDKKRLNNRKLGEDPAQPHQSPKQPTPRCPECRSVKVWKAGFRYPRGNEGPSVQRYLCRDCGYRFSEASNPSFSHKPMKKPSKQLLNNIVIDSNRQVCVTRGTKNLAIEETRQKQPMREGTKPDLETVKGLIVKYMAWLEKEGYSESNKYLTYICLLVKRGANMLDGESVKEVIAKQPWKNGSKMLAVYAYDAFAKMQKISWTPPKYTQEETLPFVPDEKELDQLIASCRSHRMAAFLQTLKETFADPGEALRLRWIDISGNVITINRPVKGHNPRQLKVSNKLLAMLNTLPKTSEQIFPTAYSSMYGCFERVRKRAARILQNPRLLKIHFTTFRHWGGTMIAHYTHGNVLTVKRLLGHKRIQNTMKYIHMIHFKDDEFEVATASTIEEAKKIITAGFEYVTEMRGIKLFRKPKRFGV